MKEYFKDIPGYEKIYQISNKGKVKSLERKIKHSMKEFCVKKEKLLKPGNTKGYLIVVLSKNNTRKTFRIHQLMAMTFLDHKPCGHEFIVDHKDNDKLNNKLNNIQLITNRKNSSKDRKGYSSEFIGVSLIKKTGKWRSQIQISGKVKNLGSYVTELEASKVYQKKLNSLK